MINNDIKIILILSGFLTIVLSVICFIFNATCGILCLFLGCAVTAVFLFYTNKRYKKLRELNDYLSLVCSGNYDLNINDNTEGELSILQNNLYKVITILQTQKDKLAKDKTSLSDSLADISHQIKTPLTSIMVLTDLLKDEKDEENRAEFLSVIENQLDKMKWLIITLLKLSKLDAGTIELKNENQSIRQVINESLTPFLISLELKNVKLINDVNDFSFKGDKNWTVEAFGNIIKNCLEHTDGGGEICISSKTTNIYDSIFISDNGCGISAEDLPHIFERFYYGKNNAKNSIGIGLALAKTIFEKEHANIRAESTLGKGTTFEIRFYKAIV